MMKVEDVKVKMDAAYDKWQKRLATTQNLQEDTIYRDFTIEYLLNNESGFVNPPSYVYNLYKNI